MFKIDLICPIEYGIMFLHDTYVSPVVPDDAGNAPVTSTNSCIAFLVLNEVDGCAQVIVADSTYQTDNECFFRGVIETDNGSLSITNSNGFQFASVPVNEAQVSISIYMSKEYNPDVVEIIVSNVSI